jgi:hypothetical protein
MRRNRTGPATVPASGEGPGSNVVMACVGYERERAAERAATGGGRGAGVLVGGQAASTVGDTCYAVALPWHVLTGHGGAAAPGTTLAAYGIARAAAMPAGLRAAALEPTPAPAARQARPGHARAAVDVTPRSPPWPRRAAGQCGFVTGQRATRSGLQRGTGGQRRLTWF